MSTELFPQELGPLLELGLPKACDAMEARDPYTAGHQFRVSLLAVAIAQKLQWDEARIDAVRIAALVHDIGKFSLSEKILSKKDGLSQEEWQMMQRHCDCGFAILKDVPRLEAIAETVRQHHERLDGSGYPRGLKGEQILPAARVVAVADTVDSMASDRPYREAMGLDAALAEIERQAGIRLDAELVSICVRLFREEGFSLPGAPYKA